MSIPEVRVLGISDDDAIVWSSFTYTMACCLHVGQRIGLYPGCTLSGTPNEARVGNCPAGTSVAGCFALMCDFNAAADLKSPLLQVGHSSSLVIPDIYSSYS